MEDPGTLPGSRAVLDEKSKVTLLVVENNDYQTEQTVVAKRAAQEFEVDLQIIQKEHDAVMQSQEVLKLLHSPAEIRPDVILFQHNLLPIGCQRIRW